ncbi:MAG: sulfotransferase domain-containing protein [Rhizobiaceae bacterium]
MEGRMLLVVGWPKSGTTSLFDWMSAHPMIQPSRPKETFYLMDPEHPLFEYRGISYANGGVDGIDSFFDVPNDERIKMEACTQNVYQDSARAFAASLSEPPLIVFLLREPASRIFSAFRYARNNIGAIDPELDFDTYVRALLNGKTADIGRYYRSEPIYWISRQELLWSKYAHWIERWRDAVPADRIHTILFEDLKQDGQTVMSDLCAKLRIDPDPISMKPGEVRNATHSIRHHRLHRLAKMVRPLVPDGFAANLIAKQYFAFQGKDAAEERNFKMGLADLRAHFRPKYPSLSTLLDLDLSSWVQAE